MEKAKTTKQMFTESLMKICRMDSSQAQDIANYVSENQIIRSICNESITYSK